MHVDDNQIIPTLVCVATIMTLHYISTYACNYYNY